MDEHIIVGTSFAVVVAVDFPVLIAVVIVID